MGRYLDLLRERAGAASDYERNEENEITPRSPAAPEPRRESRNGREGVSTTAGFQR
jgi:hypothetical protein